MEMSILNLKDQVFGDAGYSSALTLAASELDSFRQVINAQWLDIINTFHPDLAAEAKALGIQNYHQISNKVDHKKIWAKKNRVLTKDAVLLIKELATYNL